MTVDACLTTAEATAVFGHVRRAQRATRGTSKPFTDASAGWLRAPATEPADDDTGRRALGALRRELASLLDSADAALDDAEKTVLSAYYGLHVYPSDLSGPIDPVTTRAVRRRGGRYMPYTRREVLAIRTRGLAKVAAVMEQRSANPTTIGLAVDPFATTWMASELGDRTPKAWPDSPAGRVAVDHARELLSVGDEADDSAGGRTVRRRAGRETLLDELNGLLDS